MAGGRSRLVSHHQYSRGKERRSFAVAQAHVSIRALIRAQAHRVAVLYWFARHEPVRVQTAGQPDGDFLPEAADAGIIVPIALVAVQAAIAFPADSSVSQREHAPCVDSRASQPRCDPTRDSQCSDARSSLVQEISTA